MQGKNLAVISSSSINNKRKKSIPHLRQLKKIRNYTQQISISTEVIFIIGSSSRGSCDSSSVRNSVHARMIIRTARVIRLTRARRYALQRVVSALTGVSDPQEIRKPATDQHRVASRHNILILSVSTRFCPRRQTWIIYEAIDRLSRRPAAPCAGGADDRREAH